MSAQNVCELNNADRRSANVDNLVQVGEEWLPTTDGLVKFEGSRYYSKEAIRLKYEVNMRLYELFGINLFLRILECFAISDPLWHYIKE